MHHLVRREEPQMEMESAEILACYPLTTRYLMWVTPGASTARTCST